MTDKKSVQIPINSIDNTLTVNRLSTLRSRATGIYLYGYDNNYPYKIKQLALRSGSLVTAMNTYIRFLRGLGFDGATAKDVVTNPLYINRDKQTPFDLLKFAVNEKAHINFAIQVNYNRLGEAVEFNFVKYEFVRKKILTPKDNFEKYIITNIWHTETSSNNNFFGNSFSLENFKKWEKNKKIGQNFTSLEIYAYNPDPYVVREQIKESGGIDNYSGQLFYAQNSADIYDLAKYDSVIDDAQLEAEAKLFSLSNTQNSFSASGIFKYPMNLDSMEEGSEIKSRLNNLKGATNAGRFITVPYLPGKEVPQNIFENIEQNDIDKLFESQKQTAKQNIYELFAQSSILNGRSDSGMFNAQSGADAFSLYNGIIENEQQQLSIELTTLFSNSIFADKIKLPIEINQLNYKTSELKANTNDTIN